MVYRRKSFRVSRRRSAFKSRKVGRRVGRRVGVRRVRRAPLYERNTRFCNPPSRLKTRLSSATTISLAPGATSYSYNFALGSGSDPFYDNGTNQPKGWDRLCDLYQYYTIDSGVIYFAFSNETGNPVTICCYADGNATANASDYAEARNMEGATEVIATETGGSRTMVKFKKACSTRRVAYGNANDIDRWASTTKTGASEVAAPMYVHIRMQSLKSSNPSNITGVLFCHLYQNARFHSLTDINTDTTAS